MSALDNLITTRRSDEAALAADINKRKWANMFLPEKLKYQYGRGAYRHTDFNRVGEACAEIYEIATHYNYAIPNYVALRTDWAENERITPAQLSTYIGTVTAIKTAFSGSTPLPASMRRINTDDANNIEKLLAEVSGMLTRMTAIFVKSGEYNSGSVFYIPEYIPQFDFSALNLGYLAF